MILAYALISGVVCNTTTKYFAIFDDFAFTDNTSISPAKRTYGNPSSTAEYRSRTCCVGLSGTSWHPGFNMGCRKVCNSGSFNFKHWVGSSYYRISPVSEASFSFLPWSTSRSSHKMVDGILDDYRKSSSFIGQVCSTSDRTTSFTDPT